MPKFEPSEGLKSMLNAIKAKGKNTKLADFNKHSITNAQDSIYQKDCEITFPDTVEDLEKCIDFEEFTTNGRISRAPYIAVDSTEGPKKYFLSQTTRSVMPYVEKDGAFVPEGEAVHSDTQLYKDCSQMRTAGDLLNKLKGKTIYVKEVKPVQTARYANGAIVGLRTAQVPFFEYKN